MVRVEYESDGVRKACYGEIEEIKLENFIWMENDGKIIWVDKESLISIEILSVKSTVFVRPLIKDCNQGNKNTDTGIFI